MEVIALAIDGDNLVLETIPEKNEIRWPLNNLPRPLEIGSRLTLELQKETHTETARVSGDTKLNANTAAKDELMRKLLEDLVN